MSSTRTASLVTLVVSSTGLSLLILGESWIWVAVGAVLVTGGAIYLTRHFWREAGRRSERATTLQTRRLADEVTSLQSDLRTAGSSLSSQVTDVSDRVTDFGRGVLEYVAQLELDVAALETEIGRIAQQSGSIRKRLDLTDHRAQRYRDEILNQLSGVLAVYEILHPRLPYPPFGGWAIDGDCARHLVNRILTDRPTWVLEMGSGLSTLLAAQSMDIADVEGRVISLEHDELWANQTTDLIEAHGISHRCSVVHAPLVTTTVDGETFEWYDLTQADLPEQVQLIFVDGPPKATGPRARYPALPLLYDRLSVGGVVMVDDAARPDEREAVDMWVDRYPSLKASFRSGPKGMAEIVKGAE